MTDNPRVSLFADINIMNLLQRQYPENWPEYKVVSWLKSITSAVLCYAMLHWACKQYTFAHYIRYVMLCIVSHSRLLLGSECK